MESTLACTGVGLDGDATGVRSQRTPLLQPGGLSPLPQAPILCQPTTLLCGNPEKGSKRKSEVWIERSERAQTSGGVGRRRGGGCHIINGNVQGLLEDSRSPKSETHTSSPDLRRPRKLDGQQIAQLSHHSCRSSTSVQACTSSTSGFESST